KSALPEDTHWTGARITDEFGWFGIIQADGDPPDRKAARKRRRPDSSPECQTPLDPAIPAFFRGRTSLPGRPRPRVYRGYSPFQGRRPASLCAERFRAQPPSADIRKGLTSTPG